MFAKVWAAVLTLVAGTMLVACSSSSSTPTTTAGTPASTTAPGADGKAGSASTSPSTSAPASTGRTTPTTEPVVTAPTTVHLSAAASSYLAAVSPATLALTTFSSLADQWNSHSTNAEAEADAQPAFSALQMLASTLKDSHWSAGAAPDVQALIGNIDTVSGDLQGLSAVDLADASGWTATFQKDLASFQSSVAQLKHDLGLP